MDSIRVIILIVIGLILAPILWPIIKFLAIVIIVGVIGLIVYSVFLADKKRDEIAKNPSEYYENSNKDVIDAQYQEREIKEDD